MSAQTREALIHICSVVNKPEDKALVAAIMAEIAAQDAQVQVLEYMLTREIGKLEDKLRRLDERS
jgi:hypothetical protein